MNWLLELYILYIIRDMFSMKSIYLEMRQIKVIDIGLKY